MGLRGESICGWLYIVNKLKAEVWALFVAPDFQGQGIGKALLTELVSWCHQGGVTSLRLNTEDGTRAAVFYALQGWQRGRKTGDEVSFSCTLTTIPG
ncbi:hypothetical protein GCM10009092_09930 [Bowmanella denitrificans]|uniref:N-acetyltransferase domain-containing protein n=1 Tax=Bowmanella denitrificans TaxID=366582 RepID=A0ABN0WV70_9ALTE